MSETAAASSGGAKQTGVGAGLSAGSAIPAIGLAFTVASALYGLHQSQVASKAEQPKRPSDPQTPQLGSQQANQANQQRLAASAGGTITPGSGGGQAIGNDPLTPRKTLLGA